MRRSPLAYPLNRATDTDVGGAADLQTDVMRFMAILALCLVAIFALVQSIPLQPAPPPAADADPTVGPAAPEAIAPPTPAMPPSVQAEPDAARLVSLTRPKWQSTFKPVERLPIEQASVESSEPEAPEQDTPAAVPDPEPDNTGFTLRFASDAALMRNVAAGHVGFYAIDGSRARRMTVSESRISFWDASAPNAFHEMEAATVPRSVVEALERTGAPAGPIEWGVTLPGKLKTRLDTLMHEFNGGTLIITAGGDIRREEP